MQESTQQIYQPRRVETLVTSTPAPSDIAAQSSSPSLRPSPFRSSQSLVSGPTMPSQRSVSLSEQVSPPSSPSPFTYSSRNLLEASERSLSPTSAVEKHSVSPFTVSWYGTLPRLFTIFTEITLPVLQIISFHHYHCARWWILKLKSTSFAVHPMRKHFWGRVSAAPCCKYFSKQGRLEIQAN